MKAKNKITYCVCNALIFQVIHKCHLDKNVKQDERLLEAPGSISSNETFEMDIIFF